LLCLLVSKGEGKARFGREVAAASTGHSGSQLTIVVHPPRKPKGIIAEFIRSLKDGGEAVGRKTDSTEFYL